MNNLHSSGFVGVRFNPALWPEGESMSDSKGRAFFRKAGELSLSVGFMCFQGLSKHMDEISELLQDSPQTQVVIDHWGFFLQNGVIDEVSWCQLISLAQYPQVKVKVSALRRVSTEPWPHLDLDARLLKLCEVFGARRLLFGTDAPFVYQTQGEYEEGEGYERAIAALAQWPLCGEKLTVENWKSIFRDSAKDTYHFL